MSWPCRGARWVAQSRAPAVAGRLARRSSSIVPEHGIRLQNEPLSVELEAKANTRFDDLSKQHRAIPGDIETRRKRLIYRSKQRGWLEVDLLLGTFAMEHVPSLTVAEMDEYEAILNCETIDIFNFVTAKDVVPPSLDTPMMARLQQYCRDSPLGRGVEEYAAAKAKSHLA